MAHMVDTTLGHYRILRLLGRGGMGDVYLAEDTRLGRQVALKVLPAALHDDAGRRDRFEREARAVAALNHPNIVTLHSIDQADGTPFLTMEYVEGRPLGELIPSTGLPLDRLLALAIPLADAVGAAHHRGILHRDLKPANVMVTPDGRVKVLDFGLAKLQTEAAATADALPTQELTGEGRIVGTVAYMSPEQAEGKAVDQRSDVFSLGVLLYEMATGQRPFTGDSSLSVLSSILKDTPRPIAERRADLPRDFTRIVSRALNKDPELRYQSAKDLRNDLQAVKDDLVSGDLMAAASTTGLSSVAAAPPARRSRWLYGALAALVVAASGAWVALRPAPAAAPPAAANDTWTPQRLTSSGAVRPFVTLSPDGRFIAYPEMGADSQRLSLRQIATNSVVELRPPDRVNINGVAFSPDGQFLYYSYYPTGDNMATLYRIPSIGGTPVRLAENVDTAVAVSPDGDRLAFAVNYPQKRLSVMEVMRSDGSERRALTELKRPDLFLGNRSPAWSPDGSTIAAVMASGGGQTVALIDVATGAVRPISRTPWATVNGVTWDRDGRALFIAMREEGGSSAQLWRVDVDSGATTPITRDLFNYQDVSLSDDGRALAAIIGLGQSTVWVAEAGRMREPRQLTTGSGDAEGGQGITSVADGHLIFTARTSGNPDLWSFDPRNGERRALTTDPADDLLPVASPDGRQVAFVSSRDGGNRIWLMNADGTNQRPLSPGPADNLPVWTPDGSAIVYVSNMSPWRIAVTGGEPEPLSQHWPARPGEPSKVFFPRAISSKGIAAGFEIVDEERGGGWRLGFAPLDGSRPVTVLEPTFGAMSAIAVNWSPDYTAIDVAPPQPGANVMRFAIDGKPGTVLVPVPRTMSVRAAAWSFDRQRLLLSFGEPRSDVVLLRRTPAAGVSR